MTGWGTSNLLIILRSLAIGTAGGFAAQYLGLPLPFLIGSMVACMLAALARLALFMPRPVLNPSRAVLGLLLGTAISPALFAAPGTLWLSLGLMPLYILTASFAGTLFYRHIGGFERREAFFSATPGGLITMTVLAEEMGVDVRRVSLAHAARIVLVVTLLPALIGLWEGGYERPAGANLPGFTDLGLSDLALLAAAGLAGVYGGRWARLPGAPILGPMILSAALSLAGLLPTRPPVELVIVAQIVLGTSIGGRFAGTDSREIMRTILLAGGLVVLSLLITAGVALILHAATGTPFISAVLAFAPGGLAEMSLIALALGYDVGMVAGLHLIRVLIIALLAPLSTHVLTRSAKP